MRTSVFVVLLLVMAQTPLVGDDAKSADTWTKAISDRAERGKLHDGAQTVRGDSGRWQDEPTFLHAPPIAQKPAKMSLDDWIDQLQQKKLASPSSKDDNWLLFRTRQLDDND